MTAPVLEIAGLSVALPAGADRPHAVEAVSLAVDAGETLCLVGESGSGKSVIGHATMGLLPAAVRPVAGSIRLAGEDLLNAGADRLRALRCTRMSIVFQEPMTALNPVMPCGRQIDEVLERHTALDAAARRARILDMLAQVGLEDPGRVHAAYPHQLSGGQRQRIVIAMALILDPALLIADEPTTALDVTTQAQILALIRALQRSRGTAVLFITHDFGVVAEIADRIAVLQHGQIVEIGAAETVLSRPAHAYTRMLLDAVPSLKPAARQELRAPVVLSTRSLGKTYPAGGMVFRRQVAVPAAVDVDIEIRKGEVLGIVGESGSGKSTVARCIARLIAPSSGEIHVCGTDIARLGTRAMRPLRRRIQIVFQDPYRSLNPRVRVGQSIIEGPMNFGLSRADAMVRAAGLMATVGLAAQVLDRYPHQFSGGQRQRLCIARALAMEPDLLIADEAVSALDVSVQKQVLDLLDTIRRRLDLAVLFITHDLRVAAQICDRIAVMSRGRIVEQGCTAEVFLRPRHAYTQALLAAAPARDRDFGAAARGE